MNNEKIVEICPVVSSSFETICRKYNISIDRGIEILQQMAKEEAKKETDKRIDKFKGGEII